MSTKRSFLKAHELAAKFNALRPGRPADGATVFAKKASDTVGELWIYDVIGEDWWTGGGVTAKKVVDLLAEMKGVKTLNVFINSPGGDVFEAKAIVSNLERFDAEIVMHIDGIAASAATFIAMAGDKIITASHATWMVHEASALAFGRAEDMRAMADVLEAQNKDLAEKYAAQTGKTTDEMLQVMADETWMTAAEALEQGFTDEVADPPAPKEDAASAAAAKSPFIAAAVTTEERVRSVRQARRLEQLSARASPADARGQPQRTTPQPIPRSRS